MLKCDVLISGSGPAGLVLAIDLARRGVSVRLIDKATQAFSGSRGKGIQPRTQEIFEDLGIIDHIVSQGGEYPTQRFYSPDGSTQDKVLTESSEPTDQEPYHLALFIPQSTTEAVLRAKLLEYGHEPEFATELTGFVQDENGVSATVQTAYGTKIIRARYLIGCDGGRSFVRSSLKIDFPGKSYDLRFLTADVRVADLSRDVGHRWNDGNMLSQVAFDPLPGTDLFCFQTPVPMEGESDLSPEGITHLVRARTGQSLTITEVGWASAFNMTARLAAKYRVGHVFICGDAAHIHPPTGGQGLNTSVQDAYNLGWKLARAISTADESILATYEEERRPIAAGMLQLAERVLNAEKDHGGAKRGRDVLQLDLGYAGSSITFTEPAGRLRVAGERAPDAPFTTAAGLPRRLFDVFKGPHFTLLAYETSSEIKPQVGLQIYRIGDHGEIHDTHGVIVKAYGLSKGDLVLIRPDGYIGAIVSESSLNKIKVSGFGK